MRGRPSKKKEENSHAESEGLQPCTDTWCESYHNGSPRNCLKEVGDFIICLDRTRPEPISNEAQKHEPLPEPAIQACRNDVCKYYDETFVLNCKNASSGKQKLADICTFEINTVPEPAKPAEEKHQKNVVPANDKRRRKKLQITLEERDQKIIDWIDKQAHEHRQDRNGYILNALENMMLRDMEAA